MLASVKWVTVALGLVAGCHQGSESATSASGGTAVRPGPAIQINQGTGCRLEDGRLWCWGENGGSFGDGTDSSGSYSPVLAADGMTFAAFSTKEGVVAALDANGRAYWWGPCPGTWQPTVLVPQPVQSDRQFVTISTGGSHVCGIDGAGSLFCFGSNASGALGILGKPSLTAYEVPGGPYASVSTDYNMTCALTTAGEAWCWGADPVIPVMCCDGNMCEDSPMMCNGPQAVHAPTLVPGGHVFKTIRASYNTICGLDTDGVPWCWGDNLAEQLGTFVGPSDTPVRWPAPDGDVVLTDIQGDSPVCALTTTGAVYCNGANTYGALGQGTVDANPHPIPSRVPGLPPVVALAGGDGSEVCGLTASGSRYCWGNNVQGQLGDGTDTDRHSPELIPSP
jgi:alpha-tubulin suppressor-like RCC1 family protein